MQPRAFGLLLIGLGVLAVLVGVLILSGGLSWVGRLPGDLRWEGDRWRVYVPITSMLLISIGLSVLLYLFQRVFGG